jgi:hypothetical protein
MPLVIDDPQKKWKFYQRIAPANEGGVISYTCLEEVKGITPELAMAFGYNFTSEYAKIQTNTTMTRMFSEGGRDVYHMRV